MKPADDTISPSKDTYRGIDVMRRSRPQTSDDPIGRYRTAEMASVEPAGTGVGWLFWIDSSSRNCTVTSWSSRLATSSIDFMCATEMSRFWRRLVAALAKVEYAGCSVSLILVRASSATT